MTGMLRHSEASIAMQQEVAVGKKEEGVLQRVCCAAPARPMLRLLLAVKMQARLLLFVHDAVESKLEENCCEKNLDGVCGRIMWRRCVCFKFLLLPAALGMQDAHPGSGPLKAGARTVTAQGMHTSQQPSRNFLVSVLPLRVSSNVQPSQSCGMEQNGAAQHDRMNPCGD